MYHDVVPAGAEDSSGFRGRDAALYKVTPAEFDRHLRAIARSSLRAERPAITFDDGGVSALVAADALERYGFRGHFFVTTNYIGTRGFLDGAAIRELHDRGHVVGSHSCSHPLRMGHCSWTRLLDEWTRSRDTLAEIIGKASAVASVPGGDFAPAVAEGAARVGFKQLFTSEPTVKARHIGELQLLGRFTIQRRTTAAMVAGLASGRWVPRARQVVLWNAKKISKRLAGERYLQIRKLVLGHGNEVEWGDQI